LGYPVNTEGAKAPFKLDCKTRGSKVGYNHKPLGQLGFSVLGASKHVDRPSEKVRTLQKLQKFIEFSFVYINNFKKVTRSKPFFKFITIISGPILPPL
jgi:hypothetical protein